MFIEVQLADKEEDGLKDCRYYGLEQTRLKINEAV